MLPKNLRDEVNCPGINLYCNEIKKWVLFFQDQF